MLPLGGSGFVTSYLVAAFRVLNTLLIVLIHRALLSVTTALM